MKKLLLVISSGIIFSIDSSAQLGTYQFNHSNSNSCSSSDLYVVSQPANAVFSNFSRNTVTCKTTANVFKSENWSTSGSLNANYYIQFSITANPGYAISLTTISFSNGKNSQGPSNARVAHNNSGNFTTDFLNFSPSNAATTTTWNFADFNTTAGGTVTFRIYGWNAVTTNGDFYVDDVKLFGTVVTPTSANAGSTIGVCTGTSPITMTGASAAGPYSAVVWSGGASLGNWSGTGTNPATYQFTPTVTSGSFIATLTVTGSGIFTETNPTSTRTITWGQIGNWIGVVDNNWFNSANWCTLPDANTDATILSETAFQPTINADGAVCNKLTINSGATLLINIVGKIHIKGNLTNNGTAALGLGTVVFDGTDPQSINGNNDFQNLEIDNSMMVGTYSGAQTVSGIVTLTNGILYTYGNPFTLKSTSSGNAQIAGIGNGDLQGTITVERYIPAALVSSTPFNHLIASPLLTDTIVDTGITGFSDDFSLVADNYPAPTATFYSFDESASGSGSPFSYNCLRGPSQIENMSGYAAKISSTTTLDITGTYRHHVAPIKNLSYTPGSGGNGWNLVGNPYPSGLDWNAPNAWVKNYITNSIYIWNPQILQFTSYNGTTGTNGGSAYIAPMQAFFVVTNDEYPQISALNTARVTSASTFFKTDEVSELIRLKVTGNGYQDETVVYFDINASEELDRFDSYKIKSPADEVPMLAMRLGNENVSINVLPGHNTETVIPLIFNGLPGTYSISATELTGFGSGNEVFLKDSLTGNIQQITENSSYDFVSTGNDEYRFFIIFSSPAAIGLDEIDNLNLTIYPNPNNGQFTLIMNSGIEQQVKVSLFDVTGKLLLASDKDISTGNNFIALETQGAGVYILKAETADKAYNKRVVVY